MRLNNEGLKDRSQWEKAGIRLPVFHIPAMIKATKKSPKWIHFGAGNIFRAFLAVVAQALLEDGAVETGIIAAAGHDYEN